ncbi:hypothetical protein BH09BAC2_BH09BAC2_10390 [soil metagenome]
MIRSVALALLITLALNKASAQKIDSVFVNLYTDSLKKGTFNYINVDGKLANGRYIPLDSSHIIFSASDGSFTGNSLWIDKDFTKEKVDITLRRRTDKTVIKTFSLYIKKKPEDQLMTADEYMEQLRIKKVKTKEKNKSNN